MERCLSLVLNRDDNICLTLEKMEARELDVYISNNFSSSDDVRKKYASVIEPFLEQHKNYLEDSKHKRGRVVIAELQNDLTIEERRVIYKKSIVTFIELTKNKKFIDILQNRDFVRAAKDDSYIRIFSPDYSREIKFHTEKPSKYNRVMARWRNVIKDWHLYYDLIRRVLKEYEDLREDPKYKELNFPTLDRVYKEYISSKKSKLEERKNRVVEEELDIEELLNELYEEDLLNANEEPIRYKSGADTDGYPGDLERWDNSQVSTNEEKIDLENVPKRDFFEKNNEPIRYISGADEIGYPGDLEKWDNSQVSTDSLEEESLGSRVKR